MPQKSSSRAAPPEENTRQQADEAPEAAAGVAAPAGGAAMNTSDDAQDAQSIPENGEPGRNGPDPDDPDPFSDEKTDRAVEDIVAKEGDAVLAAEDEALARASSRPRRRGFWRSIGHGFGLWLGTATGRWLTFIFVVLCAGGAAAVPEARYWVLNTAGVRAGASVTILDGQTQLPLKNVAVTIAGRSRQTDANGMARLTQLRLGPTRMHISQPGFALVSRRVILGWGSNPLETTSLAPTGERYTILVHDYLSEAPLAGVLATAGDATALSDDTGKIELTLENGTAEGVTVSLSKDGYRSEQITLHAASQTTSAGLLIARKAVLINKSSGKYDLYKSDLNGANRELLLAGTGAENGNISLATSPDGAYAALVSTRDNQRDADGFLLATLTVVKIADGTVSTLAHAQQVQLIDWVGSRLLFEQVTADAKLPTASRYSLIGYDYLTNSRLQLASAPKLNGVYSVQGDIYYAVAADTSGNAPQAGLYKIRADGTGRQKVYDHEVWGGLRADYNTLALQTAGGWVAYNVASGAATDISAPATYTGRLYRDNADHSRSLWTNQDALLAYDAAVGKDVTLQVQPGLSYPVQWLGSAIVYRVVTGGEVADYVTSAMAGHPSHKIADVASTYGFGGGQ